MLWDEGRVDLARGNEAVVEVFGLNNVTRSRKIKSADPT